MKLALLVNLPFRQPKRNHRPERKNFENAAIRLIREPKIKSELRTKIIGLLQRVSPDFRRTWGFTTRRRHAKFLCPQLCAVNDIEGTRLGDELCFPLFEPDCGRDSIAANSIEFEIRSKFDLACGYLAGLESKLVCHWRLSAFYH